MPQVCPRWRKMMAEPSMWPILDVKPRYAGVYCRSIHHDITNMDLWLRRRGSGFQELTLRASTQCCGYHRPHEMFTLLRYSLCA